MFWGGMGLEEQNAASAGLSDFTLQLEARPTSVLISVQGEKGALPGHWDGGGCRTDVGLQGARCLFRSFLTRRQPTWCQHKAETTRSNLTLLPEPTPSRSLMQEAPGVGIAGAGGVGYHTFGFQARQPTSL